MTAVLYSGGVCSHLAAKRYIEQSGTKPVLLFSDTGIEDADLYRFIDDGAKSLGCELVKVSSGETFEAMIVRNKALPNDRMPFCSRELKVEPAKKWLESHPEIDTLVVGLDWTEAHRKPKVEKRWDGYTILCPMMDAPYLMKDEMIASLDIEPPRLYALGFKHNNCGGGCVRGGLSAWRHLAKTLPDVYEQWAKREDLIPGYSFARDRRNKTSKPFPLRQIRAELNPKDIGDDWGGCGCFIDDTEAA